MVDAAPKPKARNTGLRAQLLRGGVAGVAVRAGSILASLVAAVTLARILGPENYGVYAFIFSVITILGLPVKMGLPTLIVRETARADQAQDGALMAGIWRWSDRAMILMSAAVLLAVLGYILFYSEDDSSARMTALLWALPLIPLIGFAEAKSAAVRGLRRLFLGGFPNRIARPLVLSGVVLVVYTMAPDALDAPRVYMLHVLVACVTLFLLITILSRVRPHYEGSDAPSTQTRAWIVAIIPLAAIAGLQMISHNTDILMLGWLATDAEVGVYRVALSGANVALFGLTAANLVLQPYFARAWQAEDHRQLQKLATAGARVSTAASLPFLLLFWFGGTWLLTLIFGDAYSGAFWALILLCLGQTVSAFFGSVGNLLTMAGRERVALGGLVISTIVNVALNWLLIPTYGIEGAALATGVSIAVWNLCLWAAAWAMMGIDSSFAGFRPLAKPLKRSEGEQK